MPKKIVDYDQLAPTYNQRFENSRQSGVSITLHRLAEAVHARSILEVGCGTAYWLEGFRSFPGADYRLFGLDLSAGMLVQARQRQGRFHLVRGRAERLPFPARSFDLVYCVNAIHHFQDAPAYIGEAYRLLRPGGALVVIGLDPHNHPERWYVYHYFSGTYETDLARFPTSEMVSGWMRQAGFLRMEVKTAEIIRDTIQGEDVLKHPFLQKNSCSQLALLSDEDYAAGLERIRQALDEARSQGKALSFADEIYLQMYAGYR